MYITIIQLYVYAVLIQFVVSSCRNNCVGLTYCQRLDQMIDFDSGGVPKHLGQIAVSMREWEGSISDGFDLTPAEIESIKYKYKDNLELQK